MQPLNSSHFIINNQTKIIKNKNHNAFTLVKSLIDKLSLNLIQNNSDYNSKVISPVSLSPLVGMIMLAMDNNSDKEKILGLATGELTPELEEKVHIELGIYTKEHPFNKNASISLINFFASNYFNHNQDENFKNKLEKFYGAEKCETTEQKNVADVVNEYVIKKTDSNITDVFTELSPTERDNLVFAMGNILDFNGLWNNQFSKHLTKMQEFKCANGQTIENVKMMNITEEVAFVTYQGFEIIIKEFQPDNTDKLQFVVILPSDKSGQTLDNLNTDIIDILINQARHYAPNKKMNIFIPQIEINEGLFSLEQNIGKALGVTIDSSKLTKIGLRQTEQLNITQKIKVSIGEKGAKGTVVSAARMIRSAPAQPPVFKINKPCYLAIMNNNKKLIEAQLIDGKFLVTDGPKKYASFVEVNSKNILTDRKASLPIDYNNFLDDTPIEDGIGMELKPVKSYKTPKDIEYFDEQKSTVTYVINKIPHILRFDPKFTIDKYEIKRPALNGKKITQYIIKNYDEKHSFDDMNRLKLGNNKKIIPFVDDDCVTAIWSVNGKDILLSEDI